MGEKYNLTESAQELDVDPKTLRRWIAISQLPLSRDEDGDGRCRYLTSSQLENLASLHHRALLTKSQQPEKTHMRQQPEVQKQGVSNLFTQIEGTQYEVYSLRQKLRRVETSIDTLSSNMIKMHGNLKEVQQKIIELETRIQQPGNEA